MKEEQDTMGIVRKSGQSSQACDLTLQSVHPFCHQGDKIQSNSHQLRPHVTWRCGRVQVDALTPIVSKAQRRKNELRMICQHDKWVWVKIGFHSSPVHTDDFFAQCFLMNDWWSVRYLSTGT